MRRQRLALAFGLSALIACSANDDSSPQPGEGGSGGLGGDGGSDGGSDGGAGGLALEWAPCPLMTEGAGMEAECATISVPLDWATPEGRSIDVFVKRKLATGEEEAAVWMLAGGPGQPGSDFEPLVGAFSNVEPQLSFYMLDHRGMGRSTRLGCPAQEAVASEGSYGITSDEFPACLDVVRETFSDEELAHFSTTQAAEDLANLIEMTRVDGVDVRVWGGSYGSHWLNRYLLLHPEQPDAALMTAVAVEGSLNRIDRWMDGLARRYLTACGEGLCQDKFETAFSDTVDNVAAATLIDSDAFCAPIAALGWTPAVMKTLFGQWLYSWDQRKLMPAVIYRLARCNDDDVAALRSMAVLYSQPPPSPLPVSARLWGLVAGSHIIVSEMWEAATTPAEVTAFVDSAFAVHGSPGNLVPLYADWPRYTSSESALATSTVPITMLHGELDFIGSEEYQPTVDHYLGLNDANRFALVPRASHGLASPVGNGTNCGISVLRGVLADPEAPLVDCFADVQPLDFTAHPSIASAFLGTVDPWEGAQAAAATTPAPSPETMKSVHRFQREFPEATMRLRAATQPQ